MSNKLRSFAFSALLVSAVNSSGPRTIDTIPGMRKNGKIALMYRVGTGFDAHRFAENRKLILGGILIDHPLGLLGHSDADVLLHALADALLGAAGMGDLGIHFPDNDPEWKDAASSLFIRKISQDLRTNGWSLVNADLTIIAQEPKLALYREAICASIATILEVSRDCVNVKATTTDKMGFLGRGEGIAAQGVVLLKRDKDGA